MYLNDVHYKSALLQKQQIQVAQILPDKIAFIVDINFSLLYAHDCIFNVCR